MPFLLRRRADGKYYRNKGYHRDSCWRRSNKRDSNEDPRWVDDPTACTPFTSVSGMKNSRGVSLGPVPGQLPRLTAASTEQERRAYHAAEVAWYGKANAEVRRQWNNERFDALYEAVTIRYDLKVGK